MAKGFWSDTDKPIRPGFYNRFRAAALARIQMGKRGVVALPVTASWGPANEIVSITSEQKLIDTFGKNSEAHVIGRLALLGQPKELLVYRLDKEDKLSATLKDATKANEVLKIETYYPAAKEIFNSVKVEADILNTGGYIITAQVGTLSHSIKVKGTAAEMAAQINADKGNRLITATAIGTDSTLDTVQATMTTTETAGAITTEDYLKAFTAFEGRNIEGITVPTTDSAVITSLIGWATRLNKNGEHFRVYIGAEKADTIDAALTQARQVNNELVHLIGQSYTLDGVEYEAKHAAAYFMALGEGLDLRHCMTNHNTPFTDVAPRLSHEEIEEALLAGVIVSRVEDGTVIIEDDVNTYKRYEEGHNEIWGNLRAIRFMHMIDEDTANTGNRQYVGKVLNSDAGRLAILSALKMYFETLELGEIVRPGWTVEIDEERQKLALSDEFYWRWDAEYINVIKKIFGTGIIR